MEIFGIELRKKNSLENLYRDVDRVLSKDNVIKGRVSDKTKESALRHSLQKMLEADKYFDICTIRGCAELFNLYIPSERMALYQSIHCLYWNKMESEFRAEVISYVLDDFRPILYPDKETIKAEYKIEG